MKRIAISAALIGLAFPLAAHADTWKDVSILTSNCVDKYKANPDAHTRACALQCAKGNDFGALIDGQYFRFDDNGDKLALAALKKTKKKDHLRADVTGTKDGQKIKVSKIKLD